jgi:hypothetical protein
MPLLWCEPFRALSGLIPCNQVISFRYSLYDRQGLSTAVMVSHDAVYTSKGEVEEICVTTEAPVCQEDISGLKEMPERSGQGSFIVLKGSFGHVHYEPSGQGEKGDQPHHGKPAARLGALRYWPSSLVGGRIRHGKPRAVEDLYLPAIPQMLAGIEILYPFGCLV